MYRSSVLLLLFIITQSEGLCDWLCSRSKSGYLFKGCQYLCYSPIPSDDLAFIDFRANIQCNNNDSNQSMFISQRDECITDLYMSRNHLGKCQNAIDILNEEMSQLLFEYTMLSESISEDNGTEMRHISDELYMCKLKQDSSITNVDKYRIEVWYLKLIVTCLFFSLLL